MKLLTKSRALALGTGLILATTAGSALAELTTKTVSASSSYGATSHYVGTGDFLAIRTDGEFSFHSSGTNNWCKANKSRCDNGDQIKYRVYRPSGSSNPIVFWGNTTGHDIGWTFAGQYRVVVEDSSYRYNRGAIKYTFRSY